jgi:hypothetical protein
MSDLINRLAKELGKDPKLLGEGDMPALIALAVQDALVHNPARREEGVMRCPQCGISYKPDLPRGKGTAAQREQWLSGMCSDTCWGKMFSEE